MRGRTSSILPSQIAFLILGLLVVPAGAQAPAIKLAPPKGLPAFSNSAFALAHDSGSTRVAIAGYKGIVTVYDSQSLEQVARIEPDGGMVLSLAFDHDAKHLLVAGDPRRLRVYSTANWQLVRTIELPFRCGFLCTHPRQRIAALAGVGPAILFFNIESGNAIGRVDRDLERGFEIEFLPDGRTLVANGKTTRGSVSPWNVIAIDVSGLSPTEFVAPDQPFRILSNSYVGFQDLALSTNGQFFATVDKGGRLLRFDCQNLRLVQQHPIDLGKGHGLAFWSDDTIVAATAKGLTRYRTNHEPQLLVGAPDDVENMNHLLVGSSGMRCFSSHAGARNPLRVWETVTNQPLPDQIAGPDRSPLAGDGFASPGPSMDAGKTPPSNTLSGLPQPATVAESPTPSEETASSRSPLFLPASMTQRLWTHRESGKTVAGRLIGATNETVLLWTTESQELAIERAVLNDDDLNYLAAIERRYPRRNDFKSLSGDLIGSGIGNFLNYACRVDIPEDTRETLTALGFSPVVIFGFHKAVPDLRGGFFVATTHGLGKYHPSDRSIQLITGAPDVANTWLPPLGERIDELVVDAFGRAIVRFSESGQTFRWNGFDWKHLWCRERGMLRSITRVDHSVYAILDVRLGGGAAWGARPQIIVQLNQDDRWHPVDLSNEIPAEKISHLLVPSSEKLAIVFEKASIAVLDLSNMEVTATLPLPERWDGHYHQLITTPNNRFYATWRLSNSEKRDVLVVERLSQSGSHLFKSPATDARDENQPTTVGLDFLGRVVIPYGTGEFFNTTRDDQLVPIDFTAPQHFQLRLEHYHPTEVRNDRLSSRYMSPFSVSRRWTTNHAATATGRCLDLIDSHVKLRLQDGRTVSVARDSLSDSDQRFLSNLQQHLQSRLRVSESIELLQHQPAGNVGLNSAIEADRIEAARRPPLPFEFSQPTIRTDVEGLFGVTMRGLERWRQGELELLSPRETSDTGSVLASGFLPEHVMALSDGSALMTNRDGARCDRWVDGNLEGIQGDRRFKYLRLSRIGNTVLAVAFPRLGVKPAQMALAKFSVEEGWKSVFEYEPMRNETQWVLARITPIDQSQFVLTWQQTVPNKPFSLPRTHFTLHDLLEPGTLKLPKFESAPSHPGEFTGTSFVWNGMLFAQSKDRSVGILRWPLGSPSESMIIDRHDTLFGFPGVFDTARAPDGSLWLVKPQRVHRVDDRSVASFEVKDAYPTRIAITSDGTVLAYGNDCYVTLRLKGDSTSEQ